MPPQEAVSVIKNSPALYVIASIYGNGLGWFGVVRDSSTTCILKKYSVHRGV